MVDVKLKWLAHGEGLAPPQKQTEAAAGADVRAAIDEGQPLVLAPGERRLVPCGFQMELPLGYEAQMRPRSGLALKHGVTVLNAPGTIDADYRGEISVLLINHGDADFTISRGDRIAQMVVARVADCQFQTVSELESSKRGTDGYGSTGVAS